MIKRGHGVRGVESLILLHRDGVGFKEIVFVVFERVVWCVFSGRAR